MIYDRTEADVTAALAIREQKIKQFLPLTAEELATLERGFIDYNTLNRIEDKQSELRDLLVASGYSFFDVETKHWNETDIFNELELDRIVNNLDEFKKAVSVLKTTPQTPLPRFHYTNINDIERILYDLDFAVTNMLANVNFGWAIGIADVGLYFTI
jgi:hypothetical protein